MQEQFEDFHAVTISSRVVKTWSISYNGREISGRYEADQDDWGLSDHETTIDDESELTEDEIDAIITYVEDNI